MKPKNNYNQFVPVFDKDCHCGICAYNVDGVCKFVGYCDYTPKINRGDNQSFIQDKYSYPLPNDGENYKFTLDELKSLLDIIYEKGFTDGKSHASESETTTYSTKGKCSRCGKELTEKSIAVNMEDLDGYSMVSVWCEDCYNSFMKDIKTPTKAFKDVKPANVDKHAAKKIKKWGKAVEKS